MSLLKTLIDNKGRTAEEREAARSLIQELNDVARENFDDPVWRREMAAVLTESILEGFELETFYDQLVDVERIGFEDRLIIEEETGLKVFFIAKGGHIEASAMVSEAIELPRDTLGFHVYEFEDALRANFAKTISTMRNLAVRRLDFGVQVQIKNLIEAAIGPSASQFITGAGLSKSALDTAIREVKDEASRVGGGGGADPAIAIAGRSTMVDQISDFPGFADEALEELRARGRLGRYRGANVLQLRNSTDEDGVSYFPANELYVMSTDSGKFAIYGGLLSKEYVEQDNWYWHYLGRQDFGGIVHRPDRIRRFTDTNITP